LRRILVFQGMRPFKLTTIRSFKALKCTVGIKLLKSIERTKWKNKISKI